MILQKVIKILADVLNIDEDTISSQDSLEDDLGVDDLSKYEIVLAIEEEFDIEIEPDAADNMETVQDLVEVIKSAEE